MKITYIANSRIPTEKAHGIQIMKMCEAFATLGHDVELVVPRRLNPIKDDPFEYYGIKKTFEITRIPTIDLVQFGRIGFWIQLLIFSEFATWFLLFKKTDIIYTRDEAPAFYMSVFGKNVVWEAHGERMNFFIKNLLNKTKAIVTITKGIRDFYIKNRADANKILVAHDGVDINMFSVENSKEDARKDLDLPIDKTVVLYTGHMYEWKGAQVLADAARSFTGSQKAVFVGGTDKDIETFKKKNLDNKNIDIVGHRPYTEMPLWVRAADVLIIPNTKEIPTSPMKLFEYMASGTPIVASDLPSLREVLNDQNAVFVESNNPDTLTSGIQQVFKEKNESLNKAKRAQEDVKQYSWENRVKEVTKFIGS